MAANAKPIILADSMLADAGVVLGASETATGYNVYNLRDGRTYTKWMAQGAGEMVITVDCGVGVSRAADCIGIAGHNLGTVEASVVVESSPDNVSWTERLASAAVAADTAWLRTFTQASARYWRARIQTSAAAIIGVLMLGLKVQMERYPQGTYDPGPEQIVAESNRSKAGHLLGSTLRYVQQDIDVSFASVTPAWIDITFRPCWDDYLSLLLPFLWAWDTVNHASEVVYAVLPEDFALKMPWNAARRSLSLRMIAVKGS